MYTPLEVVSDMMTVPRVAADPRSVTRKYRAVPWAVHIPATVALDPLQVSEVRVHEKPGVHPGMAAAGTELSSKDSRPESIPLGSSLAMMLPEMPTALKKANARGHTELVHGVLAVG